jgi:hypothetical protein
MIRIVWILIKVIHNDRTERPRAAPRQPRFDP